ncbi:alcohol dehydrogenase catalytic domain-containing protein [Seohaeicola sp. SP36]|uniref:alcohol dehydrogenase catalytic domain-containing protein n=1 Tax=unclassified Seohaeicola TaxID=2641111 RepID=UPI00237BED0F|nr:MULTISPECIES: alcohol dehydrogenase catalytic domain-containing protein [unclassified Seohaeicola]MDD9706970.1 alcohol dehydrogenase catalytic domain-containing protein [Seohaeicola sp. 4SK31]MDD9734080.1 alcohol dehydrogenase catalytic domain-containing protein [Seohaeicola sp. SP36]
MQALLYTGPNTMIWTGQPDPVPAPGEVLVAVRAVGICGSDMHAYHGHDDRRPAPLILGHEAAGLVAAGPRKGEAVAINPLVVDPDCPVARAGRPHLSPTRVIISMPSRPGAFAEYVSIPERNLLPVPEGLSLRHAALSEPVAVSWHAVRIGMEKLGEDAPRVLVQGGGAIGLGAALVARLMGAGSVHVAEPHAGRRASVSREEGITAFDPTAQDPGPDAFDLIIDAVGAVATRRDASRLVRPGGVIVHVGLLPGNEGYDIRRITLQEITVSGSYCYTPDDFAAALAALGDGRLGDLGWVEVRPLCDGAIAFADLDAGRVNAAKIVLELS